MLPVEPGCTVPGAVIVVFGIELTVTFTGAEVPVQPVGSVTVTLYEPPVVTLIVGVIAPFDHMYD